MSDKKSSTELHSEEEIRKIILLKLTQIIQDKFYDKNRANKIILKYKDIINNIVNEIYYDYNIIQGLNRTTDNLLKFLPVICNQYLSRFMPELEGYDFDYLYDIDNLDSDISHLEGEIKNLEKKKTKHEKDIDDFTWNYHVHGTDILESLYTVVNKERKEFTDLQFYQTHTDTNITKREEIVASLETVLQAEKEYIQHLQELSKIEKDITKHNNMCIVLKGMKSSNEE